MFLKLLSYPRSILATLYFPIHTIFCSLAMIIVNVTMNNRALEDKIVIFWTKFACIMFGVEVIVKGKENLPAGGYIHTFNHTSFFDIFAMNGYLPPFRFGSKIELFKIPIFGAGMRRAGILPIARDRRDEVFKIYKETEAKIKAGFCYALAPEGTRQKAEILGPFKSGPFVLAINAKAPIVPTVIKGAIDVLPKGAVIPNWGVWKRTVVIHILPAVDATAYSIEQRPQLQEKVRAMMLEYFPGQERQA